MALPPSARLIAFVGTRDMKAAKHFYANQLGLPLITEDGFALEFDVLGTMLRVTLVRQFTPAEYTVLGWEVTNIQQAAAELGKAEIRLERFPGVDQDEMGIWTAPVGSARVAWFKDPDGNILSISQHP